MLTAATILMLPGADAASIRYSSSERIESSENLFAKSFDESSALAGEMGSEAAAGKDIIDAKYLASANSGRVALAAVGIKAKLNLGATQKTPADVVNTTPQLKAQSSDEVKKTITSELDHPEVKLPGDSPLTTQAAISKSANGAVEKPGPAAVDSSTADAEDEPSDPVATEIATGSPNLSTSGIASARQNLKHPPVLAQNQVAVLTKETKTHDAAVKEGRSAKAERIKGKTLAEATGVTETSVPTVLVAPLPGLSLNPVPQGSSKAPDDAFLSSVSAGSVASPGLAVGKSSKSGKNSLATEKSDDGGTKATVAVLGDDTAARKVEADATKAAPSTTKAVDAGNSKLQNAVTTGEAGSSFRGELKAADAGLGKAPVSMPTHIATAVGTQTVGTGTHQAVMQGDSSGIDGGGSLDAAHKTLAATPTSLEVGVANGSHGWLKIRAEMTDGGMVNASLSPATSLGQEMLHKELPALTAYLQSERVVVNNVAIQPTVIAGNDALGFERGMNGNGQGQPPQSGGQRGDDRQAVINAAANRAENETNYGGANGIGGEGSLSSVSHFGGGNWLNVRV